ncbi:class I SAM-dependent methyltransferase [Microbacterium sp. M3]|uniref:Class I SAM-dependent methyltransferase n=1 Tax=Microbacterium arthrosphaerae TaxID=792652 RepID=A0ABU4GW06_9MICO|nr:MULTISPECIES: class I SAM-dependent methyltransferase [Microbacterium]MDW4571200.1 class I SAM-dependent methyltransferase [Microbacterium arthrosphaerae]MDW7605055.1 class I SAM-dependent methyltransferase [Microbacterium sp. M3]
MAGHEEMSLSFGSAAGAYESGRPDYPREAVDWMLAPLRGHERALRVADVGAGTGKLTRTVVETGADVVAIDPDPAMLAALREHVHGVPTFAGTGERMPLPDASVDAVLFGQAWHWVDPEAASAEAARVLRADGVLGLVWNIRDESDPWVARLTAAMHGSHAEEMLSGEGPRVAAPFGGLEERRWTWTRTVTRAALLDMVSSRSYVITASEPERAAILAAVSGLFDERRLTDASGAEVVDLPYVTRAYRGIRP